MQATDYGEHVESARDELLEGCDSFPRESPLIAVPSALCVIGAMLVFV